MIPAPALAPGVSVLDDLDALVPPAFWHCPDFVETIGPEVTDLCELFGYGPNPEQRLLLDGSFGMERTGRLAAFEVVAIAARQNLKTGFMIQRALGKALLLKRPMQVWTAHKESATDQAFAEFVKMRERSDEFAKRVKRMPEGKGSKAVEFTNGCTIVFRPRTGKAGQSMSADDVDLDEYFAAEPKHEGSLIPTLSTRPNAQVGKFSSAPHAYSNLQRTLMARGRAAAQGLVYEPRLLYAEWSPMRRAGSTLAGKPRYRPIPCESPDCTHELGSVGCIGDNREVIKLCNPSAGRSHAPAIGFDFIASERRSLANPDAPPEALIEWLKERMSIGVEDVEGSSVTIFGPAEVWQAGTTTQRPPGVAVVGLAMTTDRSKIGLVGAAKIEQADPEDEEAEPVEIVTVAPILHTSDIALALKELARIQLEHDCQVVYDELGPAASLLDDDHALEKLDLEIVGDPVNLRSYARGCSTFYDKVTATPPQLLHLANQALDAQVSAADWKWVSDNRVIARRDGDEAIDITLLEAAVLAAQAAEQTAAFED